MTVELPEYSSKQHIITYQLKISEKRIYEIIKQYERENNEMILSKQLFAKLRINVATRRNSMTRLKELGLIYAEPCLWDTRMQYYGIIHEKKSEQ